MPVLKTDEPRGDLGCPRLALGLLLGSAQPPRPGWGHPREGQHLWQQFLAGEGSAVSGHCPQHLGARRAGLTGRGRNITLSLRSSLSFSRRGSRMELLAPGLSAPWASVLRLPCPLPQPAFVSLGRPADDEGGGGS